MTILPFPHRRNPAANTPPLTLAQTPGLCECGCGQPTNAATKTNTKRGDVKGEPVRFVAGHQARVQYGHLARYIVDPESGCWVWQLHVTPGGYGQLQIEGRRKVTAHVYYWEQRNGPVPDGLELDHLCKRTACVNPDHLEAVTHTENVRRSGATKLSAAEVDAIRAAVGPHTVVARQFGISPSHVRGIRSGRAWGEGALGPMPEQAATVNSRAGQISSRPPTAAHEASITACQHEWGYVNDDRTHGVTHDEVNTQILRADNTDRPARANALRLYLAREARA